MQNQHTAPQSHYINNRILHYAIINKLTSPKTKSSFNRTTNKYELRKITSDSKLTGFLTQLCILVSIY